MKKILLVDDEIDLVDFLESMLREKYDIATAFHGDHAMKILNEEDIDLVISDVMMPMMNGFDLCKTIKSKEEFAHIPVILLTAKNTLQSKIEGLEFGADVYIEKPFSKEHLSAQIASLLYNRSRIYESFRSNPVAQFSLNKPASTEDRNFIDEVNFHITENLRNPNLDVRFLSQKMAMSRSVFYRKIKDLSSMSPGEMIVMIRLRKAVELLIKEHYQIKDISILTGFNTNPSFSRAFIRHFNMTPTEYRKSQKTASPKNHPINGLSKGTFKDESDIDY